MGDGVGVDARRDVVFVENNVVRERLVVHELNSFALGNGDGVRLFISCTSTQYSITSVIAFAFAFSAPKPRVASGRLSTNPHVRNHDAHTPRARTSHASMRLYDYTRASHPSFTSITRAHTGVASLLNTYVEAELAVVPTELDGRRERRGGQREGGRRDDGSLRSSFEYVTRSVSRARACVLVDARARARSRPRKAGHRSSSSASPPRRARGICSRALDGVT